jgi:arylformamidase
MIGTIELAGRKRQVDLSRGVCIAIPIAPDGGHPRFFTDQAVRFETLASGGFTGRVSAGGSCNVDQLSLIPHCHGTHTEGVGHITRDARPVQQQLETGLIPATLISVEPVEGSRETTAGPGPVITAGQIDWPEGARALMIRTLPNDSDKCRRDYARTPPYPLLSVDAMRKIVAGGIEHLLIDTPSIDAADDGGKLAQHRLFWGLDPGQTEVSPQRAHCTITEMIYVPESTSDGDYLLSLGVSAIHGDASPSAPVIYPLT